VGLVDFTAANLPAIAHLVKEDELVPELDKAFANYLKANMADSMTEAKTKAYLGLGYRLVSLLMELKYIGILEDVDFDLVLQHVFLMAEAKDGYRSSVRDQGPLASLPTRSAIVQVYADDDGFAVLRAALLSHTVSLP